MNEYFTKRQRHERRWNALKNERNTWLEHWRELSDYVQPRRSRFLLADRNKGTKANQKIINGTPTWALRVLASGMMAGITSPARSWFRLTTPDQELAEFGSVRAWLHVCEERIRTMFARSNIYNGLHLVYGDLGLFGTAVPIVEEDLEDGLRCYVLPIGQYCLATSSRQRVDTVYRELSMTVGQLIGEFGLPNCSLRARNEYDRGNYDTWVEVQHLIEPNKNHKPGRAGPEGKPWSSCWYEVGVGGSDPQTLREGGYEEFPAMATRWSVTGEDVYGSSPAMEVLGDAKALQLLEKRKAQAVDKIVNPPMGAPMSLMNQRASLLPGDVTYFDSPTPGQRFSPVMEINPATIGVVDGSIREHEQRVKTGLYADLWLMLAQEGSPQMTAREVAERHEEKMLQLGPVMERVQDELLEPIIDRAFGILLRNGQLPPPPPELQGQEMKVDFISIMAQAQKMLGTSSVERLAGFVGNLAAANPEVLDKVDFDQTVDEYASMLGVPPGLIRPDDQVQAIRQQRAKQQQAAAAQQQAAAGAQGAKVLSETDTQGKNALTDLLGTLGPAAPSGAR